MNNNTVFLYTFIVFILRPKAKLHNRTLLLPKDYLSMKHLIIIILFSMNLFSIGDPVGAIYSCRIYDYGYERESALAG